MHNQTMNLHHAVTIFVMILALTALIIASIAISGDIDYKADTIPGKAINNHAQLFRAGVDPNLFNATSEESMSAVVGKVLKNTNDNHLHIEGIVVQPSAPDLNLLLGSSNIAGFNAGGDVLQSIPLGVTSEGIRFSNVKRTELTTQEQSGYVEIGVLPGLNTNYRIELPSTPPTAPTAVGKVLSISGINGSVYTTQWAGAALAGNSIERDDDNISLSITDNDYNIVLQNTSGNGAGAITLNAEVGGVDIDAAGTVAIDSTAGSIAIGSGLVDGHSLTMGKSLVNNELQMVFSPTDNATNETITIKNTLGTGSSAIKINAAAGGVDIDAADISLTTNVSQTETIVITNTQGNGTGAITLNAAAGGVYIDAAGGVYIDAAGGVDIDAAGTVAIDSTAGSIAIGSGLIDGETLSLGNQQSTQMIFSPSNTSTNETITIKNAGGTGVSAIKINAAAGGVDIDASGGVDIDGNTSVAIASQNGSIAIGSGLIDGETLSLGNQQSTQMIFSPSNTSTNETITIKNAGGTGNSAIKINAAAGGVDIDGDTFVTIDSESGSIAIGSDIENGQTITLGETGRTQMIFSPNSNNSENETITLTNTGGTGGSAIKINAAAGGVDIDAFGGVDIDAGTSVNIATSNSVPITIGHATSETTIGDNLTVTGTTRFTRPAVVTLESNGGIPITSSVAYINANSADTTPIGIRFNGSGTAGQILIVINTDTNSLTFHGTLNESLLRGVGTNNETMPANFVGMFVSDGSYWNLISEAVLN